MTHICPFILILSLPMNIDVFIKKAIRKIFDCIFDYICKISPVKQNKIIFDNFGGRGYGDNPKYIAEEILKQKLPYDLVWVVNDLKMEVPLGIRKVLKGSKRLKYEVLTSKVIIDNIKNGFPFPKKKRQICIQTWHGDFYLKYVEGECENMLNPNYVRDSKDDSKRTDLFLSGSSWQTNQLKNYFWLPPSCKIFECGVPRNDLYFKTSKKDILNIKKRYITNPNSYVLTYAPTFRDDKSIDGYKLDVEALYQTLIKTTSQEWTIIVRLHPNANNIQNLFHYNNHIINGCAISDPQELFLFSDVLITDYSSTMIDFAIMKKPVFLLTLDYDHYTNKCREIRPIFHKLPFKRCNTNKELLKSIESFDNITYLNNVTSFMNQYYNSFDDGHATKRVVEWIKENIGKY